MFSFFELVEITNLHFDCETCSYRLTSMHTEGEWGGGVKFEEVFNKIRRRPLLTFLTILSTPFPKFAKASRIPMTYQLLCIYGSYNLLTLAEVFKGIICQLIKLLIGQGNKLVHFFFTFLKNASVARSFLIR